MVSANTGRRTATLPGGSTVRMKRDLSGKLLDVLLRNSSSTTLAQRTYTYVDGGSVQRALVQSFLDQASNRTSYTYADRTEGVGRLLQARTLDRSSALVAQRDYSYDLELRRHVVERLRQRSERRDVVQIRRRGQPQLRGSRGHEHHPQLRHMGRRRPRRRRTDGERGGIRTGGRLRRRWRPVRGSAQGIEASECVKAAYPGVVLGTGTGVKGAVDIADAVD